ncbi:hypothetical protein SLEP1_g18682 [Rubroshorea leprosula]|uniref:Uncharacterized protein n=1 Tax=Rubroshorea leprosula TaxID=152421 RepID=A0AAV5J7J8_9ROSI|nr:hypothetical protein SLEP1_g18682 [Rubroshorea leprosula]
MMNFLIDKSQLHIQIDELLRDSSIDLLRRNSIVKVPSHLLQKCADKKVYEPQIISIGPYHHGKDHLKAMEEYKIHCLRMLLERREEKSVQQYVEELKRNEARTREYYAKSINIDKDAFVKMMLLDGCFIVELIRKWKIKELRDENYRFLTPFILRRVMHDLLLVENQLPFFILLNLFNMTVMPSDQGESFISMAITFISEMELVLGNRIYSFPCQEDTKHLLGLLHSSWFPSQERNTMAAANSPARTPASSLHACLIEVRFVTGINDPDLRSGRKSWQFIPSATQLQDAGIQFRKTEERDTRLFAINFDKGIMWIPLLVINGDTESLLRNLVAYEQSYNVISSKLVTDYITCMDCLINSKDDVELLCHRKIIENRLGDHLVVADMFNRLRNSLLISKDEFYYTEMFMEVNEHYKEPWNWWKANLRQNYFNTPWALISFLAAVFLLVLTVIQTVYSVI